MRVALVCTEHTTVPNVKGGAVQTHITGLVPHLGRLHHVTVFCTRLDGLPDQETCEGVRYVRLPAPGPGAYVEAVRDHLARGAFDLIHVFNRPAWVPAFAGAAPGAAVVLRLHNAMFDPATLPPGDAARCLAALAGVDCVSDFIAGTVTGLYPEVAGRIQTIYTGVDLERFAPAWTTRGRILRFLQREQLGLGEGPLVLFVGRLSETKGAHVLIEAMKTVCRAVPGAALLVVGSRWFGTSERTPYIDRLQAEARQLGDAVRFTGYVPAPEIERVYAAADLFVCPSQWEEPLARVLLEAMAAGLPVITTARGGNPEVVRAGVNGLVLDDHRNPRALAQAILYLINDPSQRRALGERGRWTAEARFRWSRVAAETLNLYERAVGGRGR